MTKPIIVIVGGGYGSEAKGTVAGELCKERDVLYAVRTGAINAGHTVYYNSERYCNQQLPVGWINPNTKLIIGAGAYIHTPTLLREVEMLSKALGYDVKPRIFIDYRAAVHTEEHHESEKNAGLHSRMGSTGEGVAAAITDKMGRRFDYKLFRDTPEAKDFQLVDTAEMLYHAYLNGEQILVEGTQGTMLDFHFGDYPFVTSRQAIASSWLAEAGLPPTFEYEVVLVTRTFPIRVAGNSGPLANEISWPILTRELNTKLAKLGEAAAVEEKYIVEFEEMVEHVASQFGMPHTRFHEYTPEQRIEFADQLSKVHQEVLKRLPEETVENLKAFFEVTTVTKKLRRIARLDLNGLAAACRLNGATSIALTFLNYLYPETVGCLNWLQIEALPTFPEILQTIKAIEKATSTRVQYVNVDPEGAIKVGKKKDKIK